MKKYNLNSIIGILIYDVIIYIIIIPFKMWILGISFSLLFGILLEFLNKIITELRKLNGEKF